MSTQKLKELERKVSELVCAAGHEDAGRFFLDEVRDLVKSIETASVGLDAKKSLIRGALNAYSIDRFGNARAANVWTSAKELDLLGPQDTKALRAEADKAEALFRQTGHPTCPFLEGRMPFASKPTKWRHEMRKKNREVIATGVPITSRESRPVPRKKSESVRVPTVTTEKTAAEDDDFESESFTIGTFYRRPMPRSA